MMASSRSLVPSADRVLISRAVDPRIRRVEALMDRNIHRKLVLRELARATALSTSRLSHLFKSYTGMGPSRYLKSLRMQRAKQLLETSTLTVKEIASRLGFDDPSRFVEDFRKAHGWTPLQYRRASDIKNAHRTIDTCGPATDDSR